MQDIDPRQLHEHLQRSQATPLLLDVREPWEFNLCRLPDSTLLPMGAVPARLHELDPTRETVVICHHGIRSAHVARFLEAQGFQQVINLRGGVDAWAREIDASMALY